jgi:hypothetical protein
VAICRAQVALPTGNFTAAIHEAEVALQISRSTAIDPQSSASVGEALLWRARAQAGSGDKAKARTTAQEALPHLEKNMDPASSLLAAARELTST